MNALVLRGLLFVTLALGVFPWQGPAASASDEIPPPALGYGLALGYGYGVAPRDNQRGKDVVDVRYIAIEPHIRLGIGRYGTSDRWYSGRLEGLIAATLLLEREPRSGQAGGAIIGLRYSIDGWKDLDFYGEGGLGIGALDFDLMDQDDGFSFFIHTALGARYPLNDRFSLTTSFLWQHVSNANTHLPNNGIDTVGWRVGIELY